MIQIEYSFFFCGERRGAHPFAPGEGSIHARRLWHKGKDPRGEGLLFSVMTRGGIKRPVLRRKGGSPHGCIGVASVREPLLNCPERKRDRSWSQEKGEE